MIVSLRRDCAAPSGRRMGSDMGLRILVADDHPLMRSALCHAVSEAIAGATALEAASFSDVEAALGNDPGPDILLLDLCMPGMNGLIGLALLRQEHPGVPLVIVSAQEDAATIQRTMEYGASGFVPKSAPVAQISDAIVAVMDGRLWRPSRQRVNSVPDTDASLAARIGGLTPQQLRVLAGIAEGKLNKQIAYEMGVAETTVKAHVTAILRRLGVVSRTQAAIVAGRLTLSAHPSLGDDWESARSS
jgi:DNA-binding NarL/FixJ family response regulator